MWKVNGSVEKDWKFKLDGEERLTKKRSWAKNWRRWKIEEWPTFISRGDPQEERATASLWGGNKPDVFEGRLGNQGEGAVLLPGVSKAGQW